MFQKMVSFFSNRYNSTPELHLEENQEQKKQTVVLAADEIKLINQTEKSLELAISQFRKGLEAFNEKKKAIISEKENLQRQLTELEGNKEPKANPETNESNEELESIKTEGSEAQSKKNKEAEEKLRILLYHNLYTEIPNLINTIELRIHSYLQEIYSLETKKSELMHKRKELERFIYDTNHYQEGEMIGSSISLENPSLVEEGVSIPMQEFNHNDIDNKNDNDNDNDNGSYHSSSHNSYNNNNNSNSDFEEIDDQQVQEIEERRFKIIENPIS